MGRKGVAWLYGQGRGRQCLESGETEKQGHPGKGKERETENTARVTESGTLSHGRVPWLCQNMKAEAQQRIQDTEMGEGGSGEGGSVPT